MTTIVSERRSVAPLPPCLSGVRVGRTTPWQEARWGPGAPRPPQIWWPMTRKRFCAQSRKKAPGQRSLHGLGGGLRHAGLRARSPRTHHQWSHELGLVHSPQTPSRLEWESARTGLRRTPGRRHLGGGAVRSRHFRGHVRSIHNNYTCSPCRGQRRVGKAEWALGGGWGLRWWVGLREGVESSLATLLCLRFLQQPWLD